MEITIVKIMGRMMKNSHSAGEEKRTRASLRIIAKLFFMKES